MPGIFVLTYIELQRQKIREENIRKRCLRDFSNPLTMRESSFIEHFIEFYRVNKQTFVMIIDKIGPQRRGNSIPKVIQLCATLRFLAVGGFQGVVFNDINISIGRSSMCKVLWNVMEVMENELCPLWIKLEMQADEICESKSYFYEKYRIPNVLGCVDGTHIRIIKSSSDESLYYNRKGYFSLNAMIICDYKIKTGAVDACRPGSCHDSFIWSMSQAKYYYENSEQNGFLLGDSGYPLEEILLTPYRNPAFGSIEHCFKKKHCAARNIVERTIGNIKARFRCLQNALLHYQPPKVIKIINVCCALHNICKSFNISDDIIINNDNNADNIENDEDEDDDGENELINSSEAITIRNHIANSLRNDLNGS